jgi:putative oxidoreductase
MNMFLLLGGALSLIISCLHIAIIIGGADWYRFFGAAERMVLLAKQGSILPTISTLGIAAVFFLWALYAFSGAGLIRRLPLLKQGLVVITSIYLMRGLALFPVLFFKPEIVNPLIVWSSIICIMIACVHAIGIFRQWPRL